MMMSKFVTPTRKGSDGKDSTIHAVCYSVYCIADYSINLFVVVHHEVLYKGGLYRPRALYDDGSYQ